MRQLLHQSGFYIVVTYCLVRLYELLWAQKTFPFMLHLVMAAGACYVGLRLMLVSKQGIRVTSAEMSVAGMLFLFAFSLAGQYAFVGSMTDMDGVDTFTFTINILINDVFWLLAGAAMSTCRLEYSLPRAITIIAVVGAIVLNASGEDSLFIDYYHIVSTSELESLTHLNVAEFAVCLIFICYASVKRLRVVVFLVSIVILFLLGGRSSLYFTIATIGAYELLSGSRRSILVFGVLGIALAGLFFIALQVGLLDYEDKFVQEMLLTEGLEEDASYRERSYIALQSFGMLSQQWMFGDPKLIASSFGQIGNYLHNLLSVWQFFGILPFLAMVAILIACLLRMRKALSSRPSPLVTFGSLILIYTVISVIASKFFGFRFLWVSIGFWMLKPDLSPGRYADVRMPFGRKSVRGRRRRSREKKLTGSIRF